jgi:Rieske Fe-S protein
MICTFDAHRKTELQKKNKISRKDFLRLVWVAVAAPFVFVWGMSVKRFRETKETSELRINSNIPDGISFFDEVIISKKDGVIKAFSAHCTHLGCLINETQDGLPVCPCHGSRFDTDGRPVAGPAVEKLRQLSFIREKEEIVVAINGK